MTAGLPAVVHRALAAARRDDVAGLDALVDWGLSGAGAVLRGLAGVDAADHGPVARAALADLDSADPATRSAALRHLHAALSRATAVAAADAATRRAVLDAQTAPPPVPVPVALAALVARAADVVDVLVAVGPGGERTAFAVTPDGRSLVVPPDPRAGQPTRDA